MLRCVRQLLIMKNSPNEEDNDDDCIINGNGGCRRQQPTGGLTAQAAWLGMRVGSRLALYYIHQMNRVKSRNNLCHNSTINIVPCIIIIIIIMSSAISHIVNRRRRNNIPGSRSECKSPQNLIGCSLSQVLPSSHSH